jgi:hypothetical protein
VTLNWTEVQPTSTVECLLLKLEKAKKVETLILSVDWEPMFEKRFYCDPFELIVYGDNSDFIVKLFPNQHSNETVTLFEVVRGQVKINMEYADITKQLLAQSPLG